MMKKNRSRQGNYDDDKIDGPKKKKNGQRCLEKCCGCISCFSTLIGLALGVACIVLPYMATSMLDQHICAKFAWILDEIEKHQENLGEYCIQECILVLLGFFKTAYAN